MTANNPAAKRPVSFKSPNTSPYSACQFTVALLAGAATARAWGAGAELAAGAASLRGAALWVILNAEGGRFGCRVFFAIRKLNLTMSGQDSVAFCRACYRQGVSFLLQTVAEMI